MPPWSFLSAMHHSYNCSTQASNKKYGSYMQQKYTGAARHWHIQQHEAQMQSPISNSTEAQTETERQISPTFFRESSFLSKSHPDHYLSRGTQHIDSTVVCIRKIDSRLICAPLAYFSSSSKPSYKNENKNSQQKLPIFIIQQIRKTNFEQFWFFQFIVCFYL